jgi:uncharacterized protein (DUF1499 family)
MTGRRGVVYLLWALLAALVGFAAYVRLAPSDPARWHSDPSAGWPAQAQTAMTPLGTTSKIVTTLNSAIASVEAQGPDWAALKRLDEIALATPRTVRLAGSPEEGRITWVTRSALWGFPDYTTAQAVTHDVATSGVTIFARSRFGRSDLGVNAARLQDWVGKLRGG